MIINVNDFYNKDNWNQYVPLEAFKELTKHVAETHLKDTTVKNLLSITYSVDDYGENPIYLEYLDEKDQKHLVKLKPAIHEELDNVLKQYAKITYVDTEIAKAIQASKDYTDEAKETLTILINGSKEEAINISKQYTNDRETAIRNDLNTGIDNAKQESLSYTDSKVNETKTYAEDQNKIYGWNGTDWAKCNGNFTVNHDDTKITKLGYRQNTEDTELSVDFRTFATNTELKPIADKLSNITASHKAPFIYWLPNIDINTMKLEDAENDVKVTLNDGDVVYWRKNEYQPSDLTEYAKKNEIPLIHYCFGYTPYWKIKELNLEYMEYHNTISNDNLNKAFRIFGTSTSGGTSGEKYFTIPVSKNVVLGSNNYQTTYHSISETPVLLNGMKCYKMGDHYMIRDVKKEVESYSFDKESISKIATIETVEAIAQEQTATNIEIVPVSLQQKTRTSQEIVNNSTLVETKDFYILNLDFSFIPPVLPTSVETNFNENVLIDAPEFNGKSFNIEFKANEHVTTSKGVIGETLSIKTCPLPIDETIKTVEVVVNDKIIIRKETE